MSPYDNIVMLYEPGIDEPRIDVYSEVITVMTTAEPGSRVVASPNFTFFILARSSLD